MTSTTAQPAEPAQQRSRGLILFGAVSVALISTAAAYTAMVGFGLDVLAMGAIAAFAFAGVFELSLVTVALMAREASQHGRPAGTLLTLTWVMSLASGFFAGWHEIHLGHPVVAAAFRFIVPLLAALMWHLALIGDRHLAAGRSFAQLRADARLAVMFRAVRSAERAYHRHQLTRTARTRRHLERAQARQDRAEDRVLDTVPPAEVRAAVTEWRAAVVDVSDTTTDIRLHESRRLIALRAPREVAGELVAINPAPAEDVLQALPAGNDQAAEPTPEHTPAPIAEIASERPAPAPAPIPPAETSQEPTEATTAPTRPISPVSRPHLAAVKEPAEGRVVETSTAPEPEPPAKSSTDTTSTAELTLEAAALKAAGHPVKEIARRLDVSERTVYRLFKKASAKAS